jgi:hypothetical protein
VLKRLWERNHGEQNRRSHARAHSLPFTFMIAIVLVPFSPIGIAYGHPRGLATRFSFAQREYGRQTRVVSQPSLRKACQDLRCWRSSARHPSSAGKVTAALKLLAPRDASICGGASKPALILDRRDAVGFPFS